MIFYKNLIYQLIFLSLRGYVDFKVTSALRRNHVEHFPRNKQMPL